MALDRSQLLKMSSGQLDELFGRSPAGPLPDGEGTGTAIVWPGTYCAPVMAWLARWFFWQGKVFDAKGGCLKNRVTAWGIRDQGDGNAGEELVRPKGLHGHRLLEDFACRADGA